MAQDIAVMATQSGQFLGKSGKNYHNLKYSEKFFITIKLGKFID